ncbi:phosphate ABC transporter substrate-binding protein PstS [Cyanobacterium aponinum UTEX 3222]|uniref:phosphate ABC transporter substrate-binding protein PstS n=1 Tax=Cyanobacterium aponinum TaxID=379064 RepID=UPI000C12AC5B|nr:phosphate ABC transporter substrate-binding protein PstS [Cyanobacterium aponinum]PHV61622.1 phosphate ABC transporter substrate-binding protein PstS [Cyanobacterium aponinum IPPAS B-1201]WRL36833.1 phosphate ABC transporter substrate-binding protein PstS [Cyanobacterium aponinum UTEX 3221]WRL43160.1 phosphate ABC transporter substrate-binding protein PstS [Cyanobacterium aponinum UTEX 3222]
MGKFKSLIPSALGGLLFLSAGLTGCGNKSTSSVSAPSVDPNQIVMLKGSGATFPAPLYQKWIQEYSSTDDKKNIRISYDSVGSGAGVKNFLAQEGDFGASDAPLRDDERQKFPENRGKPIQIPMTGGLLVFAYNLANYEGLDDIRLSRNTYCGIVTGKITKWNDPAIVADNPDVRLPDIPLLFVHRSDGSGTTFIFTSHIEAVCPDWKAGSGKEVEWPIGIPAPGNEGVSTQIQQTAGAIGYIEYSYSKDKNLQTAVLENKSGNFIKPSPENASKAFVGQTVPDDFALVIPDTESPDAYPIVGLTWLLLYTNYDDPSKAEVVKNFVQWSLVEGDESASTLGYLPIPDDLQEKVITTLNQSL